MRFCLDDKFWVVTDPRPESELGDVCFESSIRNMALQFKGGLSLDDNPTVYTDRAEAEREARRRLKIIRALRQEDGDAGR